LKKEFTVNDEWVSFEIHPETPLEGVLLNKRLPQIDWEEMYERLRQTGSRFGISFGQVTLLPNSRTALEASEYARDHGMHAQFHEKIFYAYFTENQDIGRMDVVLDIAALTGLDALDLRKALHAKRYFPRLQATQKQAHASGITGVPTFIIGGTYKVVGAQPIEVFRDIFLRISKGYP
jgi:predicted DsbA family dithiol-disulfide isomerase